ncbi:hypothetical protein BpHYR1_019634 [Brachionus plicatilis]|uniref:Uncharacterized protein n=1 Tax=Brachionus plicatilis TaxID=10195 RepID=A0A3M7P638_BRAPC|nr:hypothetical protein BpHYR1_019634 [Brachionus plicatilis]
MKKCDFSNIYWNNFCSQLNSSGVGKNCEIDESNIPRGKHLKDLSRECIWVFGISERFHTILKEQEKKGDIKAKIRYGKKNCAITFQILTCLSIEFKLNNNKL